MNQPNQAQQLQSPNEFKPVVGGGNETSASAMLVAAYAAFWLILLGVVLLSWRRQRELSVRLAHMEKVLSTREPLASDNG